MWWWSERHKYLYYFCYIYFISEQRVWVGRKCLMSSNQSPCMIEKSSIIVVECTCTCTKDENCSCKRMHTPSCSSAWTEYKSCSGGLLSSAYAKVKRMCDCIPPHIYKFQDRGAHTHGLWDKHQQKSDCIKSTYVAAHFRYSVYNAMNLHYLNSLEFVVSF